jgi:hypothetical protein
MSSKFRNGDKVIANIHKGEVVAVTRDHHGKYIYTVKFKDPGLIPSEMDYPENYLKLDGDDSVCPICKSKWSVLKFNMKTWKDCKKCNKTYEAIMEEIQKKDSPPPIPGKKKYHDEDLLNEFQLMLDGFDDIDLDDTGIYNYADDDDDTF